jgi:hypothetical protein
LSCTGGGMVARNVQINNLVAEILAPLSPTPMLRGFSYVRQQRVTAWRVHKKPTIPLRRMGANRHLRAGLRVEILWRDRGGKTGEHNG